MLGTFHSICARILRREAEYLPISSNFVIFDTDDQERIVSRPLGIGPGALLAGKDFVTRDHPASLPNDHARQANGQVVKKVNSIVA